MQTACLIAHAASVFAAFNYEIGMVFDNGMQKNTHLSHNMQTIAHE